MHFILAKLLVVAVVSLSPVLAETIHGVALFTRHGDRMLQLLAPKIMLTMNCKERPSFTNTTPRIWDTPSSRMSGPFTVTGMSRRIQPIRYWASRPTNTKSPSCG